MLQSVPKGIPSARFQHLMLILLILILLLIPLAMSNHAAAAASSGLLLLLIFFFPGYLLLGSTNILPNDLTLAISPVFGIVFVTTVYDVFARASLSAYFFYFVAVLSTAGIVVFVLRIRREPLSWNTAHYRTILAGSLVALCVAPLYWRSGRFSGDEFVFHGPAGQDPLFHVALVQRLLQRVPADNLVVSGVAPSVYHYFSDLALALTFRAQQTFHFSSVDLFDLYYRSYPTMFYFLLGVMAYLAGRQIVGSAKGGILGVLLLLGAGGLGWTIGILQTASHANHLIDLRERLFLSWTTWDGIDAIIPLVHRPANSSGLLICLASLNVLLPPERTRRRWLVAGLLLGLMAGFNFTLAATFGAASVLGSLLLFLQRKKDDARNLAWLALWTFIGSLPVNASMFLSGFHNPAHGFPFSGPNLDFSTQLWGKWLDKFLPVALVPLASLLVFVILAYGLKLFGVRALLWLDLGEDRHRSVAMVFALAFAITFIVGVFFPYRGVEIGMIFIQPTLWMLGLFALRPIGAWLESNQGKWRTAVLWGILGLTWIQAMMAFNFSYETAFGRDTARALTDIRSTANPIDVVAYLPTDITQKPVWSYGIHSTNFAVMAMTGLDGYFSSQTYSRLGAASGLRGKTLQEISEKAELLYEQRRADVEAFLTGQLTPDGYARLEQGHVRWVVVLEDSLHEVAHSPTPWRRTNQIRVYKLSP